MRTRAAIHLLNAQIQYIGVLRPRHGDWAKFNSWQRETEVKLERIFGTGCKHVRTFKGISYSPGFITVGVGQSDSERDHHWQQGLDEAHEFLRVLKDEMRRSSSFGSLRARSTEATSGSEEKITLSWVASHLPISYVIGAITVLLAVFLAGVRVGQIPVVRELLQAVFPK